MNVKTNTLQKYIDIFGEKVLVNAIKKAQSLQSPNSVTQVTNPIMRFLMNTNYISNNRLYTHKKMGVPPEDYSQFRLISAVLSDLKPEILANESYVKQLAEKLLHPQAGPMLSAMNEILVAAYYKYLGIKVALNSSAQQGAADIDLVDLQFATDTKTMPNKRLLLEAIVNDSAKEIVEVVKLVRNQGLLISVFEPDKKKFKQSFKLLANTFKDATAGHYRDDTLVADIMDNDYQGADFHISVQPNNVNLFFQASWDMGPAIDDLKIKIEKSVEQAKVLSKQAIPWIMVPRDATRNGIEVQVLRFAGEFHDYVFKHPDIFAMPVYSLEFEGNKVATIFDIFETGQNIFKIKADTFHKFVEGLMKRPELYV